MMDSKQPSLVYVGGSDDVGDDTNNKGGRNKNLMVNGIDRKAIAYLLRYETMVRQQEAEHLATLAHLRPLFTMFSNTKKETHQSEEDMDLEQEISLTDLKRFLDVLEDDETESYMQTDRQLVLVLKTLTLKESTGSITWAEFLQCYKTVVSGMQTLQNVSAPDLRARSKDRTLSMISLFEPPAARILDESVVARRSRLTTATIPNDKRIAFALIGALIGACAAALVSTATTTTATSSYFTPSQATRSNIRPPPPAPAIVPVPAPAPSSQSPKQETTKMVTIPVTPQISRTLSSSMATSRLTNSASASPAVIRMTKPHAPMEHRTKVKVTLPTNKAPATIREGEKGVGAATIVTSTGSIDMQLTGISAAFGGVTGMLVAPVVWTFLNQIPTALAGLTVGGWGVVTLAGAVILQGFVHSVGSVVKAVKRKTTNNNHNNNNKKNQRKK